MERGLISVDRWAHGSQVYFLTHLHSDHTQGLTAAWARGLLFCSRITAKLLPFKFPGLNLSLLRVLDVGTWHSLSLMSPSTGEKILVEVMAIDAHHCPGAVMFLFRGDFGCMLYTGDFRWESSSKRAQIGRTMLVKALKDAVVDTLYLDNTYCNPSFDFPSREDAAQQIVDIINFHPFHDIVIGIDSLGKEELLLHISRVLNIKIWVWPERLQTMHHLGFHDIFTTKTSVTRVRAVPCYSFSIETLEGMNTIRPTIGIMPSGLPWVIRPLQGENKLSGSFVTASYNRRNWSGNDGRLTTSGSLGFVESLHKHVYSVPYSDHSCFMEIEEFIKLVQPMNMKGIVSSSSCYVEPLHYFGRLCVKNQPSLDLHHKEEKSVGIKRVITVQEKSFARSAGSTEVERKRRRLNKVSLPRLHMSKVNVLRRAGQGAKIAETECSD